MSAADTVLYVVVPYVAITVFVVGRYWRCRYDKFGWTTRPSQLYERRRRRWGNPLTRPYIVYRSRDDQLGHRSPRRGWERVG